jgi:hypothetical protein
MWLIDSAVVFCQGLIKQMGMALGGRRSKLGSFRGPQNEETLNGTHPATCAAMQTNSDAQLPYRFALDADTHANGKCQENCVSEASFEEVLEACQNSQDAQVGYACDYQNKRAAESCNEVEECIKGHRKLRATISCNRFAYVGERHVARLCADAYGKGIALAQQESINLRVAGANDDVTSAESFRTASIVVFPGADLIQWRKSIYQNADNVNMLGAISVDRRDPRCKTPIVRNLVFLYGHRLSTPAIWYCRRTNS